MECSCKRCSSGCTHKPGWFKPEELEPLAKFLNMSLEDAFKQFLAVDWWEGEPDIFLISPAITSMTPGSEFPEDPRGTCVFYKDDKCAIHAVKPFECRECDHTTPWKQRATMHEEVAQAWLSHQDIARKLLGQEPETSSFSMLEALSGLGGGFYGLF